MLEQLDYSVIRDYTLVFPLKYINGVLQVLLGEKIKEDGFGFGMILGFGGKVDWLSKEPVLAAAVRELEEESKLRVLPEHLINAGQLLSSYQHTNSPSTIMRVHLYHYNYRKEAGIPQVTNEMSPRWYNVEDLPYHLMFKDNKLWKREMLIKPNSDFLVRAQYNSASILTSCVVNGVEKLVQPCSLVLPAYVY